MTHDESAKLARAPIFPMEHHIIKLGSDVDETSISCLWWQHQSGLPEPGEMFKKMETEFERTRAELRKAHVYVLIMIVPGK